MKVFIDKYLVETEFLRDDMNAFSHCPECSLINIMISKIDKFEKKSECGEIQEFSVLSKICGKCGYIKQFLQNVSIFKVQEPFQYHWEITNNK